MDEYPRVQLDGLATVQSGYSFKSADWQMTGVPVVKITNVKNGRIDRDGLGFVSPDVARLASRFELKPEDVLIAMTGYVGEMAIVRENDLPLFLNQRVGRCEPLSSKLDKRFLFYALSGEDGRRQLENLAQGSAQPNLSAKDFGLVEINLPPLKEQHAIAGVLGALDDKIESNRRISESLRQLIKIEWDIAKDESWSAKSLSSLASFVNGGAFTKGATGSGRMVIRIAELNSGPGGSTIYNDLDVPNEKVARPGDILMSWSGSLGVYIWVRDEAIINQHIFKVIPDEYPAWLVFNWLNEALPFFRQTASDKATTMGHIQRHHLDDAQVQVPSSEALHSLNVALNPMWQRMILSEVEAMELAALRDSLLPELLSGRLRVRDAEKVVEGTV